MTHAPADLERHELANLRDGQLVPCPGKTAWVVAWDSVTLRVRVAFDGTQGQLAGLCYFHMGSAKDVARCAALDHVHKMHARVASGEVHPAVEALIVSVFSQISSFLKINILTMTEQQKKKSLEKGELPPAIVLKLRRALDSFFSS